MTNDVHELHETSISTPSDTEIRIERTFDAPRELLWEAFTDPELITEWLGPRDLTMTIEEMDVRPGGSWRFTHRRGDEAFVFFGEFREVVPPELLVRTFNYEGMPDTTSVERAEFEELDGGRTRIVSTATYPSKESRDGMLDAGMEKGVREGYAKLDELVARRQSD